MIENIIDVAIGYLLSPSLTVGIIAAIGYIFRDHIAKVLTSRLERNVKVEISKLESELRQIEGQASAARQFALSHLERQDEVLVERRVRAVETIWQDTVWFQQYRFLVEFLKTMNFDVIDKGIGRGENRDFIATLTPNLSPEKLKMDLKGAAQRPFLSPMSWALFSSYAALYSIPMMVFLAWRSGIQIGDGLNRGDYAGIVNAIIPGAREAIAKHGPLHALTYLDQIEQMLLEELRLSLSGSSSSKEATDKAIAIIQAVEAARAKAEPPAIQ